MATTDRSTLEAQIVHTTRNANAAKKAGDARLHALLVAHLAKLHGMHAERLAEEGAPA